MDDTANESIADNAQTEMSTEQTKLPTAATENVATKSGNDSKKDSSLEEDLLGANSLLMSDSDDENDVVKSENLELNHVKITEATDKSINDIALPENAEQAKEAEEIQSLSPIKVLQKKKKFSAILDSDTDEDESKNESIHISNVSENTPSIRPKFSALIDTDSETDDEQKQNSDEDETKTSSKYKVFDFDEEDSESQTSKKQKSKKTRVGLVDSDTNSNSDAASSADESANEAINNEGHESEDQLAKKEAQLKQKRASAKKALDEIQAIQSEQQRLHREAHISIPYHKPKRHTLQEFLKRRTIMKPGSDNECSAAVANLRQKPLKMSPEELEEYAKLMEDRAKEASEFFKSESESEEEELKVNVGVMDIEKPMEAESSQQNQTEIVTEIETNEMIATPISNEIEMETNAVCSSNGESAIEPMNIDASEAVALNEPEENTVSKVCSSQPIVTEVLELPRLDLSTLHLTEEQSENVNASEVEALTCDDKPEGIKETIRNELQSTESPRIKGDANMLIDLDSGDMIEKKPTGADNLLQRLLATHKAKKAKVNETVNILSSENGKLEMTTATFHHHDDPEVNKEQKPGAAYLKLKENLKTLIKKKRLEELQKKQEDEDEYTRCLEGDEDYEIDEEYEIEGDKKVKQKKEKSNYDEIVIDDEENDVEHYDDEEVTEEEIDNEEADASATEEDKNDANFMDVAAVEAETDSDSNSESDDDADDIDKDLPTTFKEPLPTTQRKTRIIERFVADSDHEDDDDMDLLKTQIPIAASNVNTPLFGTIDSPLKKSLSLPTNIDIGNTQELLELCSGTFEATQKPPIVESDAVIISQIPQTLQNSETDTTKELLALCSGSFDNQQQQTQSTACDQTEPESSTQQQNSKPTAYKILSSDEEDTATQPTQNRVKKLRKKLKKGQAKLGFSDDEDESSAEVENEFASSSEGEHIEDDAVDMPQTYIEYDSDENEIVVEMTKEDCIQRANNFFEKEAELSESEWGSADEDEKNIDQYEGELGDEDDFDREELQQELGQIHARKMLDEDIRDVRKLQEMFFEDEENDGVGRQRQFRWKNAESGFSLDDTNRGEDGGFNGAESGDEEQKQEHLWRKIRYEREQLLKEQGLMENSQESLTAKLGVSSPLSTLTTSNIGTTVKNATPIIGSNGKKIQIITKKTTQTTIAQRRGSPFLISSANKTASTTVTSTTTTSLAPKPLTNFTPPSTASILQPKSARGSFLMRDKESLTKFANLKKGKEDDETAGTVSIKSIKAKNFVFATLTKEEHEQLKRKADDLMNSSSENGTNFMKKPRINNQQATPGKQCFIDKLLS